MTSFKKGFLPTLALLAVAFSASAEDKPISLTKADCTNSALAVEKIRALYNAGNKAHLIEPKDPGAELQYQTVIHTLNYYTEKAISDHVCAGGENQFKPRQAPVIPQTQPKFGA